jgi:hypothetical protein
LKETEKQLEAMKLPFDEAAVLRLLREMEIENANHEMPLRHRGRALDSLSPERSNRVAYSFPEADFWGVRLDFLTITPH